ncbi:hypothetical protein V6N13_097202 [Hibiscus sabdariffa]|uniref:Nucleolar GTP-binding protein 1 n=1 Tax=Hibiscus sabdariffa TaxID=183260 RepID=A0ABR2BYH2_9ROSI
MRGAFSLLESCQVTCTGFLSRTFKFSTGCYQMQRPMKHNVLCFCRNMQTYTRELVKASYVSTPQTQPTKPKDQSSEKVESIGAFQKLPRVMPSVDILQSVLRKAKRVLPTKAWHLVSHLGIANIAKRERNRGAKQLDALMKELAIPLRGYIENFPKRIYLHPYERSLIELTFGAGHYEESLSKREAEGRLNEGLEKLQEIFKREGQAVDNLLYIAKTLRAIPVVDLEMPTLCLVGAPNVAKSSLVRLLSTGKPEVETLAFGLFTSDIGGIPSIVWLCLVERMKQTKEDNWMVCNYPFTTRGILMGHITIDYQHFQVTDTPGLLKRCDEDMNNLEMLTLAVLSHLPTAIHVHDLSGECGMSPSDQFMIYKEISKRFDNHLWLDKNGEADHLELAKYRKIGPEGAIRVSVKTEEGVNELTKKVHELLMAKMGRIGSKSIQDNSEVA